MKTVDPSVDRFLFAVFALRFFPIFAPSIDNLIFDHES